jgi:hypothetical protein
LIPYSYARVFAFDENSRVLMRMGLIIAIIRTQKVSIAVKVGIEVGGVWIIVFI